MTHKGSCADKENICKEKLILRILEGGHSVYVPVNERWTSLVVDNGSQLIKTFLVAIPAGVQVEEGYADAHIKVTKEHLEENDIITLFYEKTDCWYCFPVSYLQERRESINKYKEKWQVFNAGSIELAK